jgi:adenosylcobinamide-GDP ribazoletransferase
MLPMSLFLRDLVHAVGFLSRLPLPSRWFGRHFEGHDGRLSRAVRAFPLAGLVIALPAALVVLALASLSADAFVTAVLAVALQIALTGALHEDGLADTADGIGARRGREHALEIMEDSTTGAYGVLALTLSVLLRVAATAALIVALPGLAVALLLIATAMLSRAAMVLHWHLLPSAKTGGLAVSVGTPRPRSVTVSTVSALAIALPATLLSVGPVATLSGLLALGSAAAIFSRRTHARLGGFTGDTIGATQQIGEMAFLAALAITL